jgi:Holliday junction resolvase RusA-like endonuclease
MSLTLSFRVDGNPLSQNRAWRIVTIRGRGTLAKTKESKVWQLAIAGASAAALEPLSRWDGKVRVDMDVHFDSMRPDLDGPVKLALDALQGVKPPKSLLREGGCIVNDRQVQELRVRRFTDKIEPRLEVRVHFLDEEGVR